MPIGRLATSFALLRLPHMPEVKRAIMQHQHQQPQQQQQQQAQAAGAQKHKGGQQKAAAAKASGQVAGAPVETTAAAAAAAAAAGGAKAFPTVPFFTPSTVDPDTVKFKDKTREKQRQGVLRQRAAAAAKEAEEAAASKKRPAPGGADKAGAGSALQQHQAGERLTAAKRRKLQVRACARARVRDGVLCVCVCVCVTVCVCVCVFARAMTGLTSPLSIALAHESMMCHMQALVRACVHAHTHTNGVCVCVPVCSRACKHQTGCTQTGGVQTQGGGESTKRERESESERREKGKHTHTHTYTHYHHLPPHTHCAPPTVRNDSSTASPASCATFRNWSTLIARGGARPVPVGWSPAFKNSRNTLPSSCAYMCVCVLCSCSSPCE